MFLKSFTYTVVRAIGRKVTLVKTISPSHLPLPVFSYYYLQSRTALCNEETLVAGRGVGRGVNTKTVRN